MASMIVLYGQPEDPAAFEDYYASRHIPYAVEHMPGVTDAGFDRQHYAFLVTETEFDDIFARIRGRNLPYWSDPMHHDPNRVNPWLRRSRAA